MLSMLSSPFAYMPTPLGKTAASRSVNMMDKEGVEVNDRQGIADIFAEFYAELYQSQCKDVVSRNALI